MQIFSAEQTRERLPFDQLIPALKEMFATGCEVPLRHHHTVGVTGAPDATLLLMPAWRKDALLGIKVVNVFPGNASLGLPGLTSTYLLYDGKTGQLLSLLDGNEITARRTAAASALAASFLARPDARRLLIVGAGRVASLLADAYLTVRPIEQVTIWNPHEARGAALVDRLQAAGINARFNQDLEAAVTTADIISSATLSTAPLIQGAWLRTGTHVDLIGSFRPGMREVDDEVIRRADIFIDTPTALHETGDLMQPIENGVLKAEAIQGDLEALCRGKHPGRSYRDQVTVFKSVGSALEDLAAAALVFGATSHGLEHSQ